MSEVLPTVWTSRLVLLMLNDAVITEYFATLVSIISRMLTRVPGHTEADETLEVIRRILQPVQIVATYAIGRHILSSYIVAKGWIFVDLSIT